MGRHAQASHVDVVLHGGDGGFDVTVNDDGIGFDVTGATEGGSYGLQGMRERARMIGAQLQIMSEQDVGSTVRLSIRKTVESPHPVVSSDEGI